MACNVPRVKQERDRVRLNDPPGNGYKIWALAAAETLRVASSRQIIIRAGCEREAGTGQ